MVIKGTVSRIESKDYYVFPENSEGLVRCTLRGKFKNDFKLKKDKLFHIDISVVGDYVEYELNRDGTGVINKIEERRNYISRKAPRIKGASYRGERLEQIIAANIENLFIVSSVAEPSFNNRTIDRLLVTGERCGLNLFIIINKVDLDENSWIDNWVNLYEKVGYKVLKTSIVSGEGLNNLKNIMSGGKNLFFGHSGVGKSSLLNKIFPELKLKVGEISNFTEKGTHTTVTSIMIKLEKDTYIIDTPGIREIDPFGIRKEDLGHYFIEFPKFSGNCRFNTCTHLHEPGCAVIEAVQKGMIFNERYDSYLRILETIEQDILF